MYTFTSVILICLTVLVITLPPFALASCGPDVPGCEDAQREQDDNLVRSFLLQDVDKDQVEVVTEGRDDGQDNTRTRFKASLQLPGYPGGTGKILRLRVEYRYQVLFFFLTLNTDLCVGFQSSATDADVEYEISLFRWVEYLENSTSAQNGYNAGVDQIVSEWPLQNCQWDEFDKGNIPCTSVTQLS